VGLAPESLPQSWSAFRSTAATSPIQLKLSRIFYALLPPLECDAGTMAHRRGSPNGTPPPETGEGQGGGEEPGRMPSALAPHPNLPRAGGKEPGASDESRVPMFCGLI
jgi:hypothetical protein